MSPSPSNPSKQLTIIVAATLDNGIGLNGTLPWRLPKEMKWFAKVTTDSHSSSSSSHSATSSPTSPHRMNAVIMGRKTWESIPVKWRPLKGRWNCVISRSGVVDGIEKAPYTSLHSSVLEAVSKLENVISIPNPELSSETPSFPQSTTKSIEIDRIFLIGGSQLYHQSLSSTYPSVHRILLTRIHHPYPTDVSFPVFTSEKREEAGKEVDVWRKARREEVIDWVGWEPEGGVEGKDEVRWEVEMWVRT